MDPLIRLFQQLRYGERTARGTAGGKRVCWVLAPEERRRARSNKNFMLNCDMMRDIVLLGHQEHQLLAWGRKTRAEMLATRRVVRDNDSRAQLNSPNTGGST